MNVKCQLWLKNNFFLKKENKKAAESYRGNLSGETNKPIWVSVTVVGFDIWAEYIPNIYLWMYVIKYSHKNTKYQLYDI